MRYIYKVISSGPWQTIRTIIKLTTRTLDAIYLQGYFFRAMVKQYEHITTYTYILPVT